MKSKPPSKIKLMKNIQRFMTKHRDKVKKIEFNPENFDIEHINIEIKDLNQAFDNYKIINLTDIHLGQIITPEDLKGVVKLVNNETPDIITLTGDYVSYLLDDVEYELEDSLKQLKPLDKTLAVLGNHDHWIGEEKIKKIIRGVGIIDLSNDVHTIERKRENNNYYLHIAGVDSVTVNKDRLDLVLKKLPKEGPAILLVHEPDFADISSKTNRFALQISGHSHGGQFIIPKIGTIVRGHNFVKYPLGKYDVNDMVQYTSRGLGTNFFWFRINCPPEITVFTLKSGK